MTTYDFSIICHHCKISYIIRTFSSELDVIKCCLRMYYLQLSVFEQWLFFFFFSFVDSSRMYMSLLWEIRQNSNEFNQIEAKYDVVEIHQIGQNQGMLGKNRQIWTISRLSWERLGWDATQNKYDWFRPFWDRKLQWGMLKFDKSPLASLLTPWKELPQIE